MPWKRMLANITGSVNEDLLRRIEYLLEENRVLRNQIQKRILLTDHERRSLAERAVALGKLMAGRSPSSARRRSSTGAADWSPRSLTALDFGSGTGDHRSRLQLKNSSSGWPARIRLGAMIESPVRSTIWGPRISDQTVGKILRGTALGYRLSDGGIPLGRVSFASTRTFRGRRTSSRQRFGRAGD